MRNIVTASLLTALLSGGAHAGMSETFLIHEDLKVTLMTDTQFVDAFGSTMTPALYATSASQAESLAGILADAILTGQLIPAFNVNQIFTPFNTQRIGSAGTFAQSYRTDLDIRLVEGELVVLHTSFQYENPLAGDLDPGQAWAVWSDVSPVPLPAAAWMFGAGLIGLAGLVRRRDQA